MKLMIPEFTWRDFQGRKLMCMGGALFFFFLKPLISPTIVASAKFLLVDGYFRQSQARNDAPKSYAPTFHRAHIHPVGLCVPDSRVIYLNLVQSFPLTVGHPMDPVCCSFCRSCTHNSAKLYVPGPSPDT